jgi:hypothetical protein
MMGVNHMNGTQPSQPHGVPQVMSADTPVAYYQPIAITPSTIKWAAAGIIGVIWSMYTADYLYRPARQSEFEALTKVVQVIQQGQAETSKAVERLTLAVDNLSGIVTTIKGAPKNAVKTLKMR